MHLVIPDLSKVAETNAAHGAARVGIDRGARHALALIVQSHADDMAFGDRQVVLPLRLCAQGVESSRRTTAGTAARIVVRLRKVELGRPHVVDAIV